MALTTVTAATQILANALSALDSLREQAKGSKDATLKENISKLWNDLLDLKGAVLRVEEENSSLKRMIEEQNRTPKPQIRQTGAVNYYFVGDDGPYCQPCYDGKGKLAMLSPPQEWNGGVRRRCSLCKEFSYEKPMTEISGPLFIR